MISAEICILRLPNLPLLTVILLFIDLFWFIFVLYRYYGRNYKFEVKITSFGIKIKCTQKFKTKIYNFLPWRQKYTCLGKKEKKKKKKRIKIDKAQSSKKSEFFLGKSCNKGKGGGREFSRKQKHTWRIKKIWHHYC